VLIRLVEGIKVTDEESLRQQVLKARIHLDWMNIDQTFMVDASSTNTEGLSQQYLALVVKDGLCDAFREEHDGKRPNVDRTSPDVRIFAKVESGRLWLSIDTSGRPLHQRGYRKETTHEAPLKEQLAAGLLAIAGWQDFCFHLQENIDSNSIEKFYFERDVQSVEDESKRKIPSRIPFSGFFHDPMCGTGTLAIEAALMLKQRFIRKSWEDFSLRNLFPFKDKKEAFENCVKRINSLELSTEQVVKLLKSYRDQNFPELQGVTSSLPCIAADKAISACEETKKGAQAAGVSDLIQVLQQDFFEDALPNQLAVPGTITIMNPPYDKRLAADPINDYKKIGDSLKRRFSDCMGWVVSANLTGMKSIGLRPTRNMIVYNGSMESKFCQYVVYGKRTQE
jgi:putative N6-adenine-specific DNA methylase